MSRSGGPGCAIVAVVVVLLILWVVLLANACSSKGGHIALSLFSQSGWACVDDDGRQVAVP